MEVLKERTINCVECKKDFKFTVGEQEFFLSKKLSQPKRCPECRKARKKNKES